MHFYQGTSLHYKDRLLFVLFIINNHASGAYSPLAYLLFHLKNDFFKIKAFKPRITCIKKEMNRQIIILIERDKLDNKS
jgi:hypothetical protein